MKKRAAVSYIFLIALLLASCAPELKPGVVKGAPDFVFYGDCSPTIVKFTYEIASDEDITSTNLDYYFRGWGSSVIGGKAPTGLGYLELGGKHGYLLLKEEKSVLGSSDLLVGELDMNSIAPYILYGATAILSFTVTHEGGGTRPLLPGPIYPGSAGFSFSTGEVIVQPCPPAASTITPTSTAAPTLPPTFTFTPTTPPTLSLTPTLTPTFIPALPTKKPTKKPKENPNENPTAPPPSCSMEPNNPNCVP